MRYTRLIERRYATTRVFQTRKPSGKNAAVFDLESYFVSVTIRGLVAMRLALVIGIWPGVSQSSSTLRVELGGLLRCYASRPTRMKLYRMVNGRA